MARSTIPLLRKLDQLGWLPLVGFIFAPNALIFLIERQWQVLSHAGDQVIGRDFVNYWTGAKLLSQGRVADLYDPSRYLNVLSAALGHGVLQSYSYAPNSFPLIGWLAAMPYGAALAAWTLVGSVALLAAAWPHSRKPWVAALILLSPAVLSCIDDGQNGLITGALLLGGLRIADRRPWLAGALIGVASFKPQLGLLLPVALIASRRWPSVAGAALSTLTLAAVGTVLGGFEAWRIYLTKAAPFQGVLFNQSYGMWMAMTPSPLLGARLAGAPSAVAITIQAAVSLAVAVAVWRWFTQLRLAGRPIQSLDIAVLLAAGLVATPYSFSYDMPGLIAALVIASIERPDLNANPAWRIGAFSLWVAPFAMLTLALASITPATRFPPVGAIVMLIGVACLVLTPQVEGSGQLGSGAPTA